MRIAVDSVPGFGRKPEENEDYYGFTRELFWVIDGATASRPVKVFGNPTQAVWFSKRLTEEIYRNAPRDISLPELVYESVLNLREEFKRKYGDPDENDDGPSGSVTIIRRLDNIIEVLVIGDTFYIARDYDGKLHFYNGDEVHHKCDYELAKLCREIEETATDEKIKKRLISEAILLFRKLYQNREGGYPELSVTEKSLEFIFEKKNYYYKQIESNEFMLGSDGALYLYTPFNLFSIEEFYNFVTFDNISQVLELTKRIALDDKEKKKYLRIKPYDDMTLMKVEL